jgi:alkylhydroperoxidase family enzyme
MTDAVMSGDWLGVIEDPRLRALCGFAEKLTRDPGACGEGDLSPLRALDFSDRAIHDLTLIIAYFNFVNRIASGLAVELEVPRA